MELMLSFASTRKISFPKKQTELRVPSGIEETEPNQKTQQVGRAKKQKPNHGPHKAIIRKKIHLGLRPSTQVHSRKILQPKRLT
jgi:hypothetical protein